MPVDFTLSDEQRKLQHDVRAFSENVLQPVVAAADAEPDPLEGFRMTKGAYVEAYKAGIAMCMLPAEYGGGGVSCVDLVIAAEEICAVDPGFACTVLCNGLGLMPIAWYGSDEQKERILRAATSDPTGTYLGGWTASEPPGNPGGTANFDIPLPRPAGVGLTAVRDGDHFVVNGRKYWPSSAGWDETGTNAGTLIVRTDPEAGGTEGLSALILEGDTPGVTFRHLDKIGHRLASNAEIVFTDARIPVENLLPGAEGNGDLVINRNFAWSGPVAAIAAVGMARTAYETALEFARNHTAGALKPIIEFQNVGYVLGDVASKIEMARYFCWRAADYLDKHDQHAELVGAMNKIQVTELMIDCVYKCMQIVGVNSLETANGFGKLLREVAVLPIYDGGNMGMQRRRVHGILADPLFNPRAIMDDEMVVFGKQHESIGTIAG
ncbi:acyl-CoA/acyl-ACP dehydrogenase [Pseudonocardia sp. DR1-2]|uniref:acyl-CoA dehydrogenase family protein n=1 Tax=Pseudonocardia sp. DR1-2 TaxID=2951168 RepID=UPI002043BFB4|nr:acyl-CoA dehydrogenase family protein [Pseudonocardia sp. DR1-2]MCM3849712.1 acyl-CoA/acyl-ACP dehydrogenase [Pseudonocardia sp. DR1-2]